MMKNQAWKLLVFALGYMPVYCMERTNSVSLKLDDGAVRTIPWHVAQKSNTIYTQEAWKNRLEVDFKKPIIVHNVTPEQLALFIMAAPKTEDNFDDFFKRLTQESQKNLISVAGETALNSPEITALLVQTYLPDDIARLIMMHVKDGLEHYVRCAMVAQNGSQRTVYEQQAQKTILHSTGFIHSIPKQFETAGFLCTNNSTIQRVGEERDVHFFACKKIGLYEYMVAERYSDDHNTNIKYIERKNEKESEKKELSTEYPILKAVFSPDGKYIALAFDCEKENFLLLKIDSVSNGVIQKEKYLRDFLKIFIDVRFNNRSTVLYALSSDQTSNKSQLLIYDLNTKTIIMKDINHSIFFLPSFNHNFSRMIVAESHDNQDVLSVWDISNSSKVTKSGKIKGYEKTFVIAMQYNNLSNDAAVQFDNGTIMFIHEIADGILENAYVQCPLSDNLFRLGLRVFRASLLFTHDDAFLINHYNFTNNQVGYRGSEADELPLVALWSTKTKSMIVKHRNFLLKKEFPEIIMASNNCSFITNHFLKEEGRLFYMAWGECTLYEPTEDTGCAWIDTNEHSLFSAYVLYRVCCAHKNKEDLVLHTGGAVENCIQMVPKELKQCIDKYLTIKK